MHPVTRPSLVQIMACHLFDAKPLSEPMLAYHQLGPKEHISMKFNLKIKGFHSRICIWKYCLQNDVHLSYVCPLVVKVLVSQWTIQMEFQFDQLIHRSSGVMVTCYFYTLPIYFLHLLCFFQKYVILMLIMTISWWCVLRCLYMFIYI